MVQRSIRRELPLLISALLIVGVGVVAWSAYRTVEGALGAAAVSHLATAGNELAQTLDQTGRRLQTEAARTAAHEAIVGFLSRPDAGSSTRARRVLEDLRNSRSQSYTFTIWDREGRRLLSGSDSSMVVHGGPAIPADLGARAHADGPLVRLAAGGDTAYLVVTAAVVDLEADTLGFVTEHRRISGGAQQAEFLAGLIGEDARFAIGNPDGSVWTDLVRAVAGPPAEVLDRAAGRYTAGDGTTWIAAATVVPSTSWRVWVEVPARIVMAPAEDVLRTILGFALLIVAAGVFGAWWLSRQITAPLAEVALAAEGIAHGDYRKRASVERRDEIGRLATSFNSMAARVEEATHTLEEQAVELECANAELATAMAETEVARKVAEEGATELRAIMHLVTDVVLVLDADGRYIRILETSSDALVRPADELIGRRVHEVMSPASADAILATIRRAIAEGRRIEIEYSIDLEQGRHWFAGAASPMLDGCVYWVARDITERHRLEAQLRQSQKMEAIGQLAGGIAHDFNNVLTAIRSFSELLLSDMPAGSPHRSDVTEIQAAADRAAVLTRQLLAFSRRQLLQPVPLDLNEVVTGLEEMLRRLLGEDVDLVCNLDPGLAAAIADPGQVEQIVMNLVVNARDAMPNGGRLTVETVNAAVDEAYAARAGDLRPGDYVVLAVSDTGMGMEPTVRARIFEPFFTTKEPGKGTGLGLSTVYGIVKQSGGHITVYSEAKRGTTFRIYLPVVDAAMRPAKHSAAVAPSMPTGTETILLVEDDPAVRLVAARILARQGYRVLEAPAPAAAQALVVAHPGAIDLIMTDLVLPEMSGRELGDLLNVVEPGLRILYMSGYTDDAVIRRGLLEPGMPFLSKPFTVEDVARVVRQTLDSAPAGAGNGKAHSRPRAAI